MSTQSLGVAKQQMLNGHRWAQDWAEKVRYMGEGADYDTRFDIHDAVFAQGGWFEHYRRVIHQYRQAGWDVSQYDEVLEAWRGSLTDLMVACWEEWGLTHGGTRCVDPEPREDRVLRPGEKTEAEKADRAVIIGLWVVILGFITLLRSTDPGTSIGSPYGTNLAQTGAILFGVVMTCWILWARQHEKTHPKFAKARVGFGMAGAALIAARGAEATHGARERLQTGDYSIKTPGIDPTGDYRRAQAESEVRRREMEEQAEQRARSMGGRGDFNLPGPEFGHGGGGGHQGGGGHGGHH